MRRTALYARRHLGPPSLALVLLLVPKAVSAEPQQKDVTARDDADVRDLSSARWQTRLAAAQSLATAKPVGSEAMPALLNATHDRYPAVRGAAAAAVGRIAQGSTDAKAIADAVGSLLGLAEDRPEVRSEAELAIVHTGAKAVPALAGAIGSNPSAAERGLAAEILSHDIGLTVGQAAGLTTGLRDSDLGVRRAVGAMIAGAVADCALGGGRCLPELPNIKTIRAELATAALGDLGLGPDVRAVEVSLNYLEQEATLAGRSKPALLLAAAAPYSAVVAAAVLVLTFVLLTKLATSRKAGRIAVEAGRAARDEIGRLEQQIEELGQAKAKQEHDRIARSVLQRFVTLPDQDFWPGFTIAAAFRDASDVSGDFYNWFSRTDGSVCVYLVDVEGSGIDAAIQATHAANVLVRTLTRGEIQPAEKLLEAADRNMHDELGQPNIAVTMNLAEIRRSSDRSSIRLANAGMPAPLVFRQGQAPPQQLQAAGAYVGGGYSRFRVEPQFAQTDVLDGDLLVLFSDGIIEARDPMGSLFGYAGIESAVAKLRGEAAEVIAKGILSAASSHAGGTTPSDDQTVVVVRFGSDNAAGAGVQPLIIVSSSESEIEFRLTNTASTAQVCDSELQREVKGWLDARNRSSGRVWCAVWEGIGNAVVYGSGRGDVIALRLRQSGGALVVEIEQPREWRKWDQWLGQARKADLPAGLPDGHPGPPRSLQDLGGTATLLRLADNVAPSMLGRRLTLVFETDDQDKDHER